MERERIFGVAFKIEPTSGTDAIPTVSADALRLSGIPTLEYDFLEPGERDDMQNGVLMSAERTEAAGRYGRIELTLEVKGSGAAGTAPEADALLRAAGFSKSVSAGVSVLYSTLDTGMETGTLYAWGGGKLFKLVGCVVSALSITADAAKRGFMKFSVIGKMASDPVQAALSALTVTTVNPPLFHSATASIGSWLSTAASDPLVVRSVGVDIQNTTADRPSAGATDGLIGYAITDRRVRQSMTIETMNLSSFDPFALSKTAGGSAPLAVWQIGTVPGDRLIAQTGKWSLRAPRLGGANGISTLALDGGLGAGAPTSGRELNLLYS